MKNYALLVVFVFVSLKGSGQGLNAKRQQLVVSFIDAVAHQQKDKLAVRTAFPLDRQYPLPQIKNKGDFMERYAEVFDEKLVKMIAGSDPSKDWHEVGWRGITLLNGVVWLNYDGMLRAVTYRSAKENALRKRLIEADKKGLYPSVRSFSSPVAVLETEKYRIRIDDLGAGNYRYACWPLQSTMKDRPQLVLDKGQLIPEGSGGNHKYVFANGGYTYECAIFVTGESSGPPAVLSVLRSGKQILKESAFKL